MHGPKMADEWITGTKRLAGLRGAYLRGYLCGWNGRKAERLRSLTQAPGRHLVALLFLARTPLSSQAVCPTHVGPQCIRDQDGAVCLLVILHHRDQSSPDGQARTVERVNQLWFAGLRITPAGLHAPGLKVGTVAAG